MYIKLLKIKLSTIIYTMVISVCLYFFVIHLEKQNLYTVGQEGKLNYQRFDSLVDTNFNHLLSQYQFIDEIYMTDEEGEELHKSIEHITFSQCQILLNYNENPDSLETDAIPIALYQSLPLKGKLSILELCNATQQTTQLISKAKILQDGEFIFAEIKEPRWLFGEDSIGVDNNISWVVASHNMSDVKLGNDDFLLLEHNSYLPLTLKVYTNVILKNDFLTRTETLFYGNVIDLFSFKFSKAEKVSVFIDDLLFQINNPVINFKTSSWAFPFLLAIAMAMFLFSRKLIRTVIEKLNYFQILEPYGYALLSINDNQINNSKSYSHGLEHAHFRDGNLNFCDEELQPIDSMLDARYLNFSSARNTFKFDIIASTFIREEQVSGQILVIENSSSQLKLKKYQSIYKLDPLTQLPNRAELEEFLCDVTGTYFVAIVDLDHFKQVNDQFGHHFGDLILKHVAEHFRANIRLERNDRVIRLGGEEFLILVQVAADDYDNTAKSVSHRLISFNQEGITLSGGSAFWNPAKVSFDSIYKHCDKYLYEAKSLGRKQIQVQLMDETMISIKS